MAGWLSKITGKTSSAYEAKERLKLVLIHDRTDITPATMEKLKDDLLKAISKHIQIEPDSVKITMMHEGREQRLVADIQLKHHERKTSG
ncbi:MAG: cell division topological specificity factor MinE [Pelolinea sp.]|nr:cell division topological specificity factor MinE [Pelolinea sp.]